MAKQFKKNNQPVALSLLLLLLVEVVVQDAVVCGAWKLSEFGLPHCFLLLTS